MRVLKDLGDPQYHKIVNSAILSWQLVNFLLFFLLWGIIQNHMDCICRIRKRCRMKHFGTDIIKSLRLYQSEGKRIFCHPSHTILCPLSGKTQIMTEGTENTFDAQGVLLIPCGRETELLCMESSSYLVLQLSPVFLMEAFSRDRLLSDVISSADIPQLCEILPDLFSLVPLYMESPDQNRLDINRLLFTILGDLDRILGTDPPIIQESSSDIQPRQMLVDSYITANIEKQISLQETAATCGLTPQYLSSFFQKSMNCTFMEYINRIKAEKAFEWLLRSDLSSEEVCDIAGFKTYSAFRKSIEARYGCSWDELRTRMGTGFTDLPEEDLDNIQPSLRYTIPKPAREWGCTSGQSLRIRKVSIDAEAGQGQTVPDSWKTIINIGSADALFFEPLRRILHSFNKMVSFRYCRMYGLLNLVTVYVSNNKTYYGFELVFQNLDAIIQAGLLPFLDIGYRDFPGHRSPVSAFAFNSDSIDVYYDKLLMILPEFLKASINRYGREIVEQWALEFHFSYQNNRNYTFWQFLSMFKKIELAARTILPDVCIGGLGFDGALHPGVLQSMLEQLQSLECRMDFISIHVNGLILPEVNGSGSYHYTTDENEINRRISDSTALIRRYYPEPPIFVTEFGFAHFLRSALNDSLFQTSFILRFIIANAARVQGIGYHMLDDLGEPDRPADQEFFGCAGIYSTHGLRKPSYYAFSFLSHLGNSVISMGENHILTTRSHSNYQLLAFHYQHISSPLEQLHNAEDVLAFEKWCAEDGDRVQLHFRIHGAATGRYLIKTLRMAPGQGSLHKLWLYNPSCLDGMDNSDYAFFRRYSAPQLSAQPCSVTASKELTFDVVLAPLETVLLLIDRSTI